MNNRDHSNQQYPTAETVLKELQEFLKNTASKTGNGYIDSKIHENLYWYHGEVVTMSIGSSQTLLGTSLIRLSQLTKMEGKPGVVSFYELLTIQITYRQNRSRVEVLNLDGEELEGLRIKELSPERLGRLHSILKILRNQEWSVTPAAAK